MTSKKPYEKVFQILEERVTVFLSEGKYHPFPTDVELDRWTVENVQDFSSYMSYNFRELEELSELTWVDITEEIDEYLPEDHLKVKPCPRMELQWRKVSDCWEVRECIYSLVLPLGEHDLRRNSLDAEDGELFIEIGKTSSTGANSPMRGDGTLDTPFRDTAHALWDAKALGKLPIVVSCEDKWELLDND